MRTGLYIHVPFCESKCSYCDFYSIAPATTPEKDSFLDSLEVELEMLPDGFSPQTVYVGGGTPTVLDEEMLARLLDALGRNMDLGAVEEFTVEANPGSLTAQKAELMLRGGVNRLSLGVQSFDDEVLSFLGRSHSSDEVYQALFLLRKAGFTNLSVDVIFGVPGTDLVTVESDISQAVALAPTHISSYALTIAPGTRLHFLQEQGELDELEDDLVAEQFSLSRSRLAAAGYRHYEISNFAQPGRECLHNMLYWSGGSYIGCGPAAHSHWNGVRYGNVPNLWEYIQSLLAGKSPRTGDETLAPEEKARETLIMWLRRLDGVDLEQFRQATGFDPRSLCGDAIDNLVEQNMLRIQGGVLALTEQAVFISDAVFRELL